MKASPLLLPLAFLHSVIASDKCGKTFGYYEISASLQGNAIDGQFINAAQGDFWIGLVTSSSCNWADKNNCPPGNITAVVDTGDGSLQMAVQVPGGQSVFIDKNGDLMFTKACGGIKPDGASDTGFSIDDKTQTLKYSGGRWYACSVAHTTSQYQIVASIFAAKMPMNCVAFEMKVTLIKDVQAFEYV